LAVDARCGEICGVHGRVGARARRMRGRTLTGLGPELTPSVAKMDTTVTGRMTRISSQTRCCRFLDKVKRSS
jgi:hypothetical protein